MQQGHLQLVRTAITLSLVALVAGCHTGQGPGGQGKIQSATSGPKGREVTFTAADGWKLHADWYPAASSKRAVVLLHQRGGSAADWEPLVPKLVAAGISALAIDQRGAGRSIGAHNGDDAPWDTTPDIAAAIAWLGTQGVKPDHVGLEGASYGANNALIYATAHGQVAALALLSPGLDYHGLKLPASGGSFTGPILWLSAKEDTITGDASSIARLGVPLDIKSVPGEAHGTALFAADPDTITRITGFFQDNLPR